MIIPFLEFEIFWESVFTFILIQIALWHKLDIFLNKWFHKLKQKSKQTLLAITENQCRIIFQSKKFTLFSFFPWILFWKAEFHPEGGHVGQQIIHLWNNKITKDILVLQNIWKVARHSDARPVDYHFRMEVYIFRLIWRSSSTILAPSSAGCPRWSIHSGNAAEENAFDFFMSNIFICSSWALKLTSKILKLSA